MTIGEIRKDLHDHLGHQAIIKYHLGRNKYESYQATIKELYDSIFLVEVNQHENQLIKSFSYTDIITKTIKIEYDLYSKTTNKKIINSESNFGVD